MHLFAMYQAATGEVLYTSRAASTTGSELERPDLQAVRCDSTLPGGRLYVEFEGNVPHLRAIPNAPSQSHVWDWGTKAWQLSVPLARQHAHERIKASRDAAEFGPFTWGPHTFDGDDRSRSRLNLALAGAQEAISLGDSTWREYWKLYDNTVVELTAPDLVEVVRAMGASMKAAHATAGILAYFVDQASTLEELDAVQWPG